MINLFFGEQDNQYIKTKYSLDRKMLQFYLKFARKKYSMIRDLVYSDPYHSFLLLATYGRSGFNPFLKPNDSLKVSLQKLHKMAQLNFTSTFRKVLPDFTLSELDVESGLRILEDPKVNNFFVEQYKQVFNTIYRVNDIIFKDMNDYIARHYLSPLIDSKLVEDVNIYYNSYDNNLTTYKILAPILIYDIDLYNSNVLEEINQYHGSIQEYPILLKAYSNYIQLLVRSDEILIPTKKFTFHTLYEYPDSIGRFVYGNIESNIKYFSATINNQKKLYLLNSFDNSTYLKQIDESYPYMVIDSITNTKCDKVISTIDREFLRSIFKSIKGIQLPFNFEVKSSHYVNYGFNIVLNYIILMLRYYVEQFNHNYNITSLKPDKYKSIKFYIENLKLLSLTTGDPLDKDYKRFIDNSSEINIVAQFEIEYLSKMKPNKDFFLDLLAHSSNVIICKLTTDPNFNIEDMVNISEKNSKLFAKYQDGHIGSVAEFSLIEDLKENIEKPFRILVPYLNSILRSHKERIFEICHELNARLNSFNNTYPSVYYYRSLEDFQTEVQYYFGQFDDERGQYQPVAIPVSIT